MADKNTHRYGNRNSKRSGGEMKMSTGTRSSRHSQNKTAAKRSAAAQRSASRKHPYGSHETAKGSTSSRSTARRTSYRSSASNTAAGARQSRQNSGESKKNSTIKNTSRPVDSTVKQHPPESQNETRIISRLKKALTSGKANPAEYVAHSGTNAGQKAKHTSGAVHQKAPRPTASRRNRGQNVRAGNPALRGASAAAIETRSPLTERIKNWSRKKKILLSILFIMLAAAVAMVIYSVYVISQAPDIDPTKIYSHISQQSTLYGSNNKVIDKVFVAEGNRSNAKYKNIPKNLRNAMVAIEDKTFWDHHGFNFIRIFGAIKDSIFGGGKITGTSTITQQLARNVYLPESKSSHTMKRKITEAYYTVLIEKKLEKDQILEAYMNTIYLGYGSYGIKTAAKTYFSKDLKDLSLVECAALASLPQLPNSYALVKALSSGSVNAKDSRVLYSDGTTTYLYNGDASKKRREQTLKNMYEQGYITKKAMKKALKENLRKYMRVGKNNTSTKYTYFTDYCIDEVTSDIMHELEYSYEDARDLIYTGGLKIYTTMNKRIQNILEREYKNSNNFPSVTNVRYDGNSNVLDKYGNIILYNYNNLFSGSKFVLTARDYRKSGDGSITLAKGRHLSFYESSDSSGSTALTVSIKPMWRYKNGVFCSIEGGKIDLPQKYISKTGKGHLKISAAFFKTKRGRNFFKKRGRTLYVTKRNYAVKQSIRQPQSAMVIINNKNCGIAGMVGGRNTSGKMLYNRAINPRQPGSSIKPLAIYSSALQMGADAAKDNQPMTYNGSDTGQYGSYLTASSRINDAPISGNNGWPKNWYSGYKGYQTMRYSVEQSINVNAVRMFTEVGSDYAISQLKKYGITSVVKGGTTNDENAAALALGGMTKGISPLDLASAYSTFPNRGVHKNASSYTKILDRNGNVLIKKRPKKTRVIDEGVSYIMTDILRTTVTRGLGINAAIASQPVAGKTGTTSDNYDMWFAGFTPQYSAALWFGNDVNIELTGTSDNAAACWGRIMGQVCAGTSYQSFPSMPENVMQIGGEYYVSGTQYGRVFIQLPDPKKKKDSDSTTDKMIKKKPQGNRNNGIQKQSNTDSVRR